VIRILANPASGSGRALRAAEGILAVLEAAGREAVLEPSQGPGWMTQRARSVEASLIVAVGGDGTANEVARGLQGRGIPMAYFPAGTVNLLARVYGLPSDPPGFLRMVEAGRTVPLDLGMVGERVFLSCAGAGLDADVIRRLHRGRRGPIRLWHYLPHVWDAFASGSPPRIRVEADGRDLGVCSQVIVANLPLYAGILRFAPEARGDDGLLDLVLFRGRSRLDLARYAAVALTGWPRQFDVEIVKAREVWLEAQAPVPFHLDGDEAGELPVEIRVEPAAVRLVVPG